MIFVFFGLCNKVLIIGLIGNNFKFIVGLSLFKIIVLYKLDVIVVLVIF